MYTYNENRIVVIDVDGTILTTKDRDYENSQPIPEAVETLRKIKSQGYTIILYTARGMLSLNGNIEEINRYVRPVLIKSLRRHRIPYDELIMGKPYGNIYIDNLTVDARRLLPHEWGLARGSGRSGSVVKFEGSLVTKQCTNARQQVDWLRVPCDRDTYRTPEVLSVSDTEYTMDRIDGFGGHESIISASHIDNILLSFRSRESIYHSDFSTYIDKIRDRCGRCNFKNSKLLLHKLLSISDIMNRVSSFSHGDFTYCNIISSNNDMYLIDPNVHSKSYGSWLEDLARYLSIIIINYAVDILGICVSDAIVRSHIATWTELMRKYSSYGKPLLVLQAASIIRLTAYQPRSQWPSLFSSAEDLLK